MKHSLLPWLCVAFMFIFVINGDMVSKALVAYMAISAMYVIYSTTFVSSCMHRLYTYQHSANVSKLGGVGHCFTWHVRVNFGFYFNFQIEELVHSGLCAM